MDTDNSFEATTELPTQSTDAHFLILRGLYFSFPLVITFKHVHAEGMRGDAISCLLFETEVFLWSPGWPRTHFVVWADL